MCKYFYFLAPALPRIRNARSADASAPDSAIIRRLILPTLDHTKRCPATPPPPPSTLAFRTAVLSLPAFSLLKVPCAKAGRLRTAVRNASVLGGGGVVAGH